LPRGRDIVPFPDRDTPDRIAQNAAAADAALDEQDLRRLEHLVAGPAWAGDRTSFAAPVIARIRST